MRRRCNDPTNQSYPDYGGRGISICPSWDSFETFLADMGEANGLTLERKDVNGNYCKANCCWIPKAAQRRNTRHTHQITWNGETKPLNYWAADLGITGGALKYRIAKWGLERAMTQLPDQTKKAAGQASMQSFAEKGFIRAGNGGKNFTNMESSLENWKKSSLARWTGQKAARVAR